MLLESDRLFYRALSLSDLDEICAINSDLEVVKYIKNGIQLSRQEEKKALVNRLTYIKMNPGLGFWKVCSKTDEHVIGFANLNHIFDEGPNHGKVHMGYKIRQADWRKGYGFEIGQRMLQQAKSLKYLKTLYAYSDIRNEYSLRILRKLGFEENPTITPVYDCPSVEFKIKTNQT